MLEQPAVSVERERVFGLIEDPVVPAGIGVVSGDIVVVAGSLPLRVPQTFFVVPVIPKVVSGFLELFPHLALADQVVPRGVVDEHDIAEIAGTGFDGGAPLNRPSEIGHVVDFVRHETAQSEAFARDQAVRSQHGDNCDDGNNKRDTGFYKGVRFLCSRGHSLAKKYAVTFFQG